MFCLADAEFLKRASHFFPAFSLLNQHSTAFLIPRYQHFTLNRCNPFDLLKLFHHFPGMGGVIQ